MARLPRLWAVLCASVLALASALFVLAGPASALDGPQYVVFGATPLNTTQTIDLPLTLDAGYELANGLGTGAFHPFDFEPGNCAGLFGASCVAKYSFTPTATGTFAGSLQIEEFNPTNGDTKSIYITVYGDGVLGATSSPSPDFGYVPLGSSYIKRFTLTPDVGYSVASVDSASAPFHVDSTDCQVDVAGPCHENVRFSPTTEGPASSSFGFTECTLPGWTPSGCYEYRATVTGNGVVVTNGTIKATPRTVVAGDRISVTSVTPCPAGTTSAILWIYDDNGASVQNAKASNMDTSGNWAGTIVVPGGLVGPAFVTATCWDGFTLGTYAYVAITVNPAPTTLTAVAAKKSNPVLGATLTSGGAPLAQQPVSFTAKNALGKKVTLCTATTNADGVASCTAKPSSVTFASSYTATYAGSTYYLGSTGTAKLS